MKELKVSIVIPMLNADSTILKTLNSLEKQSKKYLEIVIIDNNSSDMSVEVVKIYIKNKKNISLYVNKKNIGVGGSYNKGVKKTKGDLIVFMHSDSVLPTKNELQKLINPFETDNEVVASFSRIILPESVWLRYNFWQKVLLSRAVGKEQPGLNDKFDCIDKKTFLKIGGFNVRQYGHHIGVGADDADLHIRLKKIGKVVSTKAKVLHYHYLGNKYSVFDFIENRKLLARSYGRLTRLEWGNLEIAAWVFAIKPFFVLISLLPFLYPYNFFLIFIFSIYYYKRMYVITKEISNYRILILPFLTVGLIFYETFWMLESFLFLNRSKV